MVYCGKLSKACLPCRKRKLLCDLRKDGCSQCSRAHLACTGYRDTSAIRIRDETTAVQQKATRRTSAARPTVQSLDLSLCHQAKEIFYQNYVIGETKGYSFMRQYYSPAAKDEHLIKSISAVSLAYLHYQKHSESAQAEARLQYVDALKLTGKALQSPELATKDSTMVSILLLDLYEKITSREPQYDGAWAAHIKGALSLVQLRGDEQYRNPDGLRMLVRLSTNILISCVASDRAVPEEVVALRAAATSPFTKPSDPKWGESELMVEYARLKSQVKHNLLSDDEIVRAGMDLDTQFLTLSQQVPSSWQHKTVYVDEKSAHHYEAYHYIYTDEHIGQMWNVLRLTRILLCELIFSRCPKPPIDPASGSGQSSQEYYATTTIDQMSREICATVPQYIGGSSNFFCKDTTRTDLPPAAPVQDTRISLARQANAKQHIPCYRLIFPLYIAAQSPTASKAIKQYAIQQLHFMADHHGIKNAQAVAKILESGERRNPWNVYALLGSYAFVC
jgi:hypothetical protein